MLVKLKQLIKISFKDFFQIFVVIYLSKSFKDLLSGGNLLKLWFRCSVCCSHVRI